MKKIFNKILAGVTSVALVATLLVGVSVSKTVQAADTNEVPLKIWTLYQAGNMASSWGEGWNTAYLNSFTTADGESINPAFLDVNQGEKTLYTSTPSNGFVADIASNGDTKNWDTGTIDPWMIRVNMNGIEIQAGHDYTVSFTLKADKEKYVYINLGNEFGESVLANSETKAGFAVIPTEGKEFTYDFTNWSGSKTLDFGLMLGSFVGGIDYDMTSIQTQMTHGDEKAWKGVVTLSDLKIVDNGENPEYIPPAEKDETPEQDSNNSNNNNNNVNNNVNNNNSSNNVETPAPAKLKKLGKVKKVRAKNNKKGTVKITWKKVKNAKKYQVKVGKKIYKTKKTTLTVKKLKKGKKYTIRVRAMKKAGYKAGAWSKKVKVKVKK